MDMTKRAFRVPVIAAAACLLAGVVAGSAAEGAAGEADPAVLLDRLLPKIAAGDGGARDELQKVCLRAARPGAEEERAAVCRAIAEELGTETPKAARVWLLKQLEHVGREECVEALARALDDEDALVAERARRCLQNNPSAEAGRALLKALAQAGDDKRRVGLLNAVGYRAARGEGADRPAVRALMKQAKRGSDEVRAAAYEALARTGDGAAATLIAEGRRAGQARTKRAATDAYLFLADRLCDAGEREKAREMYRELLDSPGHLRCAAIVGIGRAGGEEGFTVVLEALADEDAEVRGAAAGALEAMPLEDLVRAAESRLRDAKPEFRAGLLRVLAGRAASARLGGEPAAGRTDGEMMQLFTNAAGDRDKAVRLVAIEALAGLGDESTVPLLVRAAAEGSKEERAVARRSLGLLRGEGDEVALALVARMVGAERDATVEVIRALAARRAGVAVPDILAAARDPEDLVRAEAMKALAVLAGGEHLPALVELLVHPREEGDRGEIEKALLAACRRAGDAVDTDAADAADARARPLLDALPGAAGGARLSLLRVLGKIGGEAAFAAVSEAVDDRDAAVRDAAVRALCDWPDARAAPRLLDLARSADKMTHRVLALRGYVRVTGLPSGRSPAETLAMYEKAMSVATRPDEKKLVLGGLAGVPHVDALRMAERHLDDAELASEAATAAIGIARAVAGAERDAAVSALKRIAEAARTDDIRKRARQAIDDIERFDDYITSYMVSGPYEVRGKEGKALVDVAFPPEEPGSPEAENVKWKLWTGSGGSPWRLDLDKLIGGDHRVAYLRAEIYSAVRKEARLEVGSDDGIKMWLNGKLVHRNPAIRGLKEGEDKVKVVLEEGWNGLLMKIIEQTGGWEACARVRAADGSKLEGLRTKAE